MNLLVIFGGMSYEHSISIKSFLNVYKNLNKDKYNLHAIYITEQGKWVYLTETQINNQEFSGKPVVLSPDATDKSIILLETMEKIKIDCIFPVLHGAYGEDGAIQGLFEIANIPYVGCKISASANSLDKTLTKIIVDTTNVLQNPYIIKTKSSYNEETIEQEIKHLTYPLFIKCASGGSSVGVYKANDLTQVKICMKQAFKLENKVLIEQGIIGKEVEVAVLGNDNPIASTVGEISTEVEFYTFDSKYLDNTSKTYIPARITANVIDKVRENALTVYKALGCSGLSRVDFFVTENDEIVFNEINTLPGFTDISMYPKLFENEGIKYSELLDRLIDLALESGE